MTELLRIFIAGIKYYCCNSFLLIYVCPQRLNYLRLGGVLAAGVKGSLQGLKNYLYLPKDMTSSHVLNFANWTTIRLNYKLEINYFSMQIMLSFQITFLRESLVSKKVISHYKSGRCFYSEIQ